MDSFEAALKEATVKGSNNVPGAAMAAVDKDGLLSSPLDNLGL